MRLTHDQRVLTAALMAGAPAVLVSMIMLWTGDYTPKTQWTLSVVIVGFWLGFGFSVRERVASPLRTFANLLEAMREGDYSIRARGTRGGDAMSEVMVQVNAMSATLRAQRLGALEATTLLRKVMEEIDVSIFAFDAEHRLRLLNRAAERLIGEPAERVLGREASALGLQAYLEGDTQHIVQHHFKGGAGRWSIGRSSFREGGLPHQLLVVSDLTRPLREEELKAWQRIVRVLGHELNNSLAPIKSIAGLVRRVSGLETRLPPKLTTGPEMVIQADSDQLEQLLINVIRNAADASLETGGGVHVGWRRENSSLVVWVRDEGPGLSNTSNLFVPFFTTKPGGSGIGLVLSRQIAEAHGGTLTLQNAAEGRGCEARLLLPL